MASNDWQQPYVNIFKHVKVEEWRKSAKEGDVSTYTDKKVKCPVFRIRGTVPANNYILIPKNPNKALGLTGRYFYLLFRPTPGKYFLVNLDVVDEDDVVVRISFSNMFKEFKSTSIWLKFPFLCGAANETVYDNTCKLTRHDLVGPAPSSVRWTCLMLDLQYTLSVYLNRCYSHLKSVKLCANMSVKNMFTTDLVLDPAVSFYEAKRKGLASSHAIAREMSFPVPKGCFWHDLYDHIRFPAEGPKASFDSVPKGSSQQEAYGVSTNHSGPVGQQSYSAQHSKPVQDRLSLIRQITTPTTIPRSHTSRVANIPELGILSSGQKDLLSPVQESTRLSSHHRTPTSPRDHAQRHAAASRPVDSEEESAYTRHPNPVSPAASKTSKHQVKQQKLLPDPILKLNRVIGFGGDTMKCALWTKKGDAVVYPCHAIIVSMKISSKQQRFFIGHTDKVSSLAFNGDTTLLASAQKGSSGIVRLWDYHKQNCLAIFTVPGHALFCLSFSYGGGILCGVGTGRHNKKLVMVWNTLNVRNGGHVAVIAKAHTEVDIHTMKITSFDDTRMVSCGRDSVHLWRVRNGGVRSCLVNLGEYQSLDFTDVAFEEGNPPEQNVEERTLYACTLSGHIFEIDYGSGVVKRVRRLMPTRQRHTEQREKWTFKTGPGIAINSLSVSSSFCATGSEDGFLRLWPLDFSTVILEADHEGPVSVVSTSVDSLQVLSATSTGNLGFLDVRSHGYHTLMRSHTDAVLGFSVDSFRRHLTTVSSDGTVRIWDMDSLNQLYDFASEDSPCSVVFHPSEQIFSCGFTSGVVRVFDISSAKLLAEHKQLKGEVVGLTFSPDKRFMYSADSQGSLALYDASEGDYDLITIVYDVVAQGTQRAPDALTISNDSCCLAFVGPSDNIVTIVDAQSLTKLLHVDVSVGDTESPRQDSALKVCFSPASAEQLLVATSSHKILWVNSKTGRLQRKVSKVDKHRCSSLAVSGDSRFLLTAGHNAIKVWDYNMQHEFNSQIFIGHSQPVHQVSFTPDQCCVVSVGDAIFLWEFLGHPVESCTTNRPPLQASHLSARKADKEKFQRQLFSAMPRHAAPLPSSPPPRLDILNDDVGQTGGHVTNVRPSSDPRASVPFLKVTDLAKMSPLHSEHMISADLKHKSPARPDCYRHFIPRSKTSSLDQSAVVPQALEQRTKLKAVIGYNGNGRGNMVWCPDQALLVYSCGSVLVVVCLHSGRQKHMLGHTEEISCVAVTNEGQMVSSAAGNINGNASLICFWDLRSGTVCKTISYHKRAVQCLAFSRDDRYLLSVGHYMEPEVAVWSSETFQLLSNLNVSGPVHDAAFSPSAASQMAFVGSRGVYFCFIHTKSRNVDLKVQRVSPPSEVGDVEVTTLCYHMDFILFTGTNRGHVCAWDVKTQRCVMAWRADEGEIGVLLCRGNRLLTGSSTCWLRLWEVGAIPGVRPQEKFYDGEAGGRMVMLEQEIRLDGTMVSAAFSHTMDMGIAGTTAGTLWYISWLEKSSIRLVSGHKTQVNDVVFSSDESHFASCSEDGSVRVHSTSSYELVVHFQVLKQACGCVCWSPVSIQGDSSLAAGYSDGTVRIFHLYSKEMEMKLHPHRVAVTAIQYSAHGHVILSAAKNGLVVVSSPADGATVRVIRDHKGAAITTIQCVSKQSHNFGWDGNELWLASSADRRVSVWIADWSKQKCNLLDWLSFPAPSCHKGDFLPPSMAAFCPDNNDFVVYTGYGVEQELTFYSLSRKQIMRKVALQHWASCFSLSPKSQLVAVGSKERVLKLIKLTNGRFQDFLHHSDSLHKCRFSPSGRLLFSVAFNEIFLWEVQGL